MAHSLVYTIEEGIFCNHPLILIIFFSYELKILEPVLALSIYYDG